MDTTKLSLYLNFGISISTIIGNLLITFITKRIELNKLKLEYKKNSIDYIYKNKYDTFVKLMEDFAKFSIAQTDENKQSFMCSVSKSIPICEFPGTTKHLKEILKLLVTNQNSKAINYFLDKISSINFNVYQIENSIKSSNE